MHTMPNTKQIEEMIAPRKIPMTIHRAVRLPTRRISNAYKAAVANSTIGVSASLPLIKQSSQPKTQAPFHSGSRKKLKKKTNNGSTIPTNDKASAMKNRRQDFSFMAGGKARAHKIPIKIIKNILIQRFVCVSSLLAFGRLWQTINQFAIFWISPPSGEVYTLYHKVKDRAHSFMFKRFSPEFVLLDDLPHRLT